MTQTGPLFFTDIIERVCAIVDPYFFPDCSSDNDAGVDQLVQISQHRGEPNGPYMSPTGHSCEHVNRNHETVPCSAWNR